MALMNRNPFYGLTRMMDFMPYEMDLLQPVDANALAIDMTSDEKNVIVRTALPGFHEDEIDVDVRGNILTISAETQSAHEDNQASWYIREMRYGKFARSIQLPEDVAADNAKASLEDGILTITLPKQKPGLVQKIAVKARNLLNAGS